jgi:hypothetical protein
MRRLVRSLAVASLLLAAPALAQEAAPAEAAAPVAEAATPAVTQPMIVDEGQPPCAQDARERGLPEGPVALGFVEADLATGRRACPRTEAGLGARFGAIIDTPKFYGSLGVNGVLFGSWAFRPDTELFATLEAVNFNYTVNAVLSATQLTLGNMTVGATHAFLQRGGFITSVSARLLLPTSLEVPGAHPVGGELGLSASWRPKGWLEVHGYLGGDVTSAFSRADPYTRLGGILLVGAQLKPTSWFAFVLDLNGRAGALTYFAPSAALRFRVAKLGIEVGATLPLAGTDRHDFIAAARFSWRID